jgi:putative endonuclease
VTARRPSRRRTEAFGRWAETAAAWRLRLVGWRIVARRWRSPAGEIDLIAYRRGILAFVEVKARADHAAALESVQPRQRRRVSRAATDFVARHRRLNGAAMRFDVVTVGPWRWPRHVADAWQPEARRDA